MSGLNVEVASFGSTIDEALANLKEAVELYFQDETTSQYFHEVSEFMLGEFSLCLNCDRRLIYSNSG